MPPSRASRNDSRAAARVGKRIATRAGKRLGPVPGGKIARGLVPALVRRLVPALAALVLAACGGASALDEAPRRVVPLIDDSAGAEAARGVREAGAQQAAEPRVVWAGEPGEPSREHPTTHAHPTHTEADARFMREMIAHHAQALIMTEMAAERTENPTIRLLARRIEVSQADEIELMLRWLADRGEAVPTPEEIAAHAAGIGHGHDGDPGTHSHAGMPGMLTADQLAELAAARGEAFDRLFLEFMIYHHEGALIMVDDLFAAPGGGQETEIFTFASHVDADQRMEIMRMRRMLAAR